MQAKMKIIRNGAVIGLLLYGLAGFVFNSLPATHSLHGDFQDIFPCGYYLRLRPDFKVAVPEFGKRTWSVLHERLILAQVDAVEGHEERAISRLQAKPPENNSGWPLTPEIVYKMLCMRRMDEASVQKKTDAMFEKAFSGTRNPFLTEQPWVTIVEQVEEFLSSRKNFFPRISPMPYSRLGARLSERFYGGNALSTADRKIIEQSLDKVRSPAYVWCYGPVIHFLGLPAFLLPTWSFVPKFWVLVNGIAILLSFILTVLTFGSDKRDIHWTQIAILAGLWLLFGPLRHAIADGCVELVEMSLILAGLFLLRKKKEAAAGISMGLATMTKFLPIGFVFWFAIRKYLKAAATALLAIAAIAVVASMTIGWKTNLSLFLLEPSRPPAAVSLYPYHASFTSTVIHRLSKTERLSPMPKRSISQDRLALAVKIGSIVSALVGIFYLAVLLMAPRYSISFPLEVGILFLLMFLFLPYNLYTYYIFAIVPVSILFFEALSRGQKSILFMTLAAYLLISPPIPSRLIDQLGLLPCPLFAFQMFYDVPFAGAFLLLMILTYLIFKDGCASICATQNR